jgi:hypothetical protein
MRICRLVLKVCVVLLNSALSQSISSLAYPPFDNQVRDYLTFSFEAEGPALTRHFVFLEALFNLAVEELKTYSKGTPAEVALRWYKWMSRGATLTSVGTNRARFYDRVIETARCVYYGSVFLLFLMGSPVRGIDAYRSPSCQC